MFRLTPYYIYSSVVKKLKNTNCPLFMIKLVQSIYCCFTPGISNHLRLLFQLVPSNIVMVQNCQTFTKKTSILGCLHHGILYFVGCYTQFWVETHCLKPLNAVYRWLLPTVPHVGVSSCARRIWKGDSSPYNSESRKASCATCYMLKCEMHPIPSHQCSKPIVLCNIMGKPL